MALRFFIDYNGNKKKEFRFQMKDKIICESNNSPSNEKFN